MISPFYYPVEVIAGPVGNMAGGVFAGMSLIEEGHLERGIEAMMPLAIKNGMKAIRFDNEGANMILRSELFGWY